MADDCVGQKMFTDTTRLKTLAYLVPDARAAFQKLMDYATAQGWHPTIVSAVRTCCEEKNLASAKGKGTRSWHIFGRAVDIELHIGAPVDDPAKYYRTLAEWWEPQGGTWGGRWTTSWPQAPGVPGASGDVMHFQWTPKPLGDVPPQEFWATGASCADVDAKQLAYLGTSDIAIPPPAVSVPPSPPAVVPQPLQKKKLHQPPPVELAYFFSYWGHLLRRRTSGLELAATLGVHER